MRKIRICYSMVLCLLSINLAYAQLAAKRGVSEGELRNHILDLQIRNTAESKAELMKEARVLAKDKTEEKRILALYIYTDMRLDDRAHNVRAQIIKKFPKGRTARDKAFRAVFDDRSSSADQLITEHSTLLQTFPQALYDEQRSGVYGYALFRISQQLVKERDLERLLYYAELLKKHTNYLPAMRDLGKELNLLGEFNGTRKLLEPAYETLRTDDSGSSFMESIGLLLVEAYVGNGELDMASPLAQEMHQNRGTRAAVLAYSKVLIAQELLSEAFTLLEADVMARGISEKHMEVLVPLYERLHGASVDSSTYIQRLERAIVAAQQAEVKAQMIKKEAPLFTLKDQADEDVSLVDFRGKVVILDFWATWCAPCIMSFPGMQAAIDKYKEDPEVVFLFVNTWQQEANYKEIVRKYMADEAYSFRVLFDEMTDMEAAVVTAYGIQGIPNKVVIDAEGYIRFQSSGGSADVQKIVDELSTMIELAKAG